jgi:hypothetical protein
MTASTLLDQLRTVGVSIRLSGERLDLTAPRGVLTAERLEQISAVKGELIAMLARPRLGSHARPFRVHGRMPSACFFNEVCDGRLIRKLEFYCCGKCSCWFREAESE